MNERRDVKVEKEVGKIINLDTLSIKSLAKHLQRAFLHIATRWLQLVRKWENKSVFHSKTLNQGSISL